MNLLILFLITIYFLFLTYERFTLIKNRKAIKYIIHVNGIRGKSTVSRLIDAGLRENGYKVFTKITGTSPRYIDTLGVEKEIKRRGKPNIREQIKIIKKAASERTDILILECMAVKPEFQKICEEKIIQANITVITNVREDHLDEMGHTLNEIATSLANTIPKNGLLFTSDSKFFNFFKEKCFLKNSAIAEISSLKDDYKQIDFPDNVALALNVCASLGVKESVALNGMKKYKKDPGALKIIKYKTSSCNDIFFINALAANDPNSSEIILNFLKEKKFWKNKRYLMVNNRIDRISRTEQYINFIKKLELNFDHILITGEGQEIFFKFLLKTGIKKEKIFKVKNLDFFQNFKENSTIFAVGNICGNGKKIVDHLEKIGETYE